MRDLITDFLERLARAKGDPHAQSALAAEFALAARPEAEREPLRAALDAAAVLRWFDPSLLAKMLNARRGDPRQLFEALKALPFVELYARGERNFRNVHESTRLGWRKQIAHDTPERFRELSSRGAACFADDLTSSGRIEWIYHLLCGDPDRAATELEKMNREWGRSAHAEDRYALTAALRELEDTQLVEGRARAWTLLAIAWTGVSRGEAPGLVGVATDALRLARAAADQPAEADAECLLGDALQAQGRLADARAAFGEQLAISRRMVEQDSANEDRQRDLALAHNRVGGVLETQGKLAEAEEAFRKSLAICRRLVQQEPANAGRRREVAAAHSRFGGVLEAQGKLADAQAAFGEQLAISRRLAEQDPSNAGWQRDLAAAYNRVGGVLEAQGGLADAQEAFGEQLAISRRLAEQDPSNAGWQRDLAVAYSRVGGVLEAQGKLADAQAAFGEQLAISRRLAEQDPSNAGWQHEVAVACVRIARLESKVGRDAAALPLYEEASRIFGALMESAPGFAQWAKERETVRSELTLCRTKV